MEAIIKQVLSIKPQITHFSLVPYLQCKQMNTWWSQLRHRRNKKPQIIIHFNFNINYINLSTFK